MGNHQIKLGKKIATGGTAEIYLPKDEEKFNDIVIKKVKKEYEIYGTNETDFLSKLDHPNIVKLNDFYYHKSTLYISLERLDIDMYTYMLTERLTLSQIRDLFSQVCYGIEFLHRKEIAHRDIKPENLLLSLKDNRIKICDFGFSTFEIGMTVKNCGSPAYIAPEALSERSFFCRPLDIWALGVVLYMFTYDCSPFNQDGDENSDIFDRIRKNNPEYPNKHPNGEIPKDLLNLIQSLLTSDPYKRPRIKYVLKSPFLKTLTSIDNIEIFEREKGVVLK